MKNDINKTVIACFMECVGSVIVFAGLTGMMVEGVIEGVGHQTYIILYAVLFGMATLSQLTVVCLSFNVVKDAYKAYKENKN